MTIGTARLLRHNRWKGTTEPVTWAPGEHFFAWLMWMGLLTGLFFVGFARGAAHALFPFLVTGLLYYAFSQVSHLNAPSVEPITSKEWAVHQICASQGDYEYGSVKWGKISNGLNNQMVHHLFPSVHPCHYPALSALLRPVFERHGLPMPGWRYTYADSWRLHSAYLLSLNRR